MTKSLKFVSALILFLTLFLTTMTVYNECESDIDCYRIYHDKKLLNGERIECQSGVCVHITTGKSSTGSN
ncbi:unnamed protein product [Trifolium pratense]|uniref:Uncharacterized protein n=1 Tax=Trifolium pratense TaxID=57577 RepID=A0ACB0LDS1_TRIPR|nr:unnamed protein product [Trifolium pratense]